MSLITSGTLRPGEIVEALVEAPSAEMSQEPFGPLLLVIQAPEDDLDGVFLKTLERSVLRAGDSIPAGGWLSTSEFPALKTFESDEEEYDQVELLAELGHNPHCLIPLRSSAIAAADGGRLTLSLGRSRGCNIIVNDPSVSAEHAQLLIENRGVKIVDLKSKNGTRLNGTNLQENAPQWLQPMDRLEFGRVQGFVCDPRALRGLLRRSLRALL